MATLIKTDGEAIEVSPQNNQFTIQEMYALLECSCLEVVYLSDGRIMWIDENGKLKRHHVNHRATWLLIEAGGIPGDYIAGSALITDVTEVN